MFFGASLGVRDGALGLVLIGQAPDQQRVAGVAIQGLQRTCGCGVPVLEDSTLCASDSIWSVHYNQ